MYKTIREELKAYNEKLTDKPEVIILTKTDMVPDEEVAKKQKKLSKKCQNILTVSVIDTESIKSLKRDLTEILKKYSV